MKLHHTTTVQATPAQVWDFLQDTRQVVACLPGAELTDELEDDRYGGVLHLAIGPLKMNYHGEVDVLERNEQARELSFAAAGRDRRGSGTVRAEVQVGVVDLGDGMSRLESVTDLNLTGRIAALGRGVQDVSNSMFNDFAGQLATRVSDAANPGAPSAPGAVQAAGAGLVGSAAVSTSGGAENRQQPQAASEVKLVALIVTVTRTRLADVLERWSQKLRG